MQVHTCTHKHTCTPSSCLLLSHAQEFFQVTHETDTSRPAYTTISHRLATVYSYMLLKTGFCLWVSTCVFHVTVSTKGPRAFMGIAPGCLSFPHSLQVVSAWAPLSTSCRSALDVSSCSCILHPSFLWASFRVAFSC